MKAVCCSGILARPSNRASSTPGATFERDHDVKQERTSAHLLLFVPPDATTIVTKYDISYLGTPSFPHTFLYCLVVMIFVPGDHHYVCQKEEL